MKKINMLILVVLACGVLVSGCSTPEPIRDLATRGASTVGLAEQALGDYLRATDGQLRARTDLLRADAAAVEREKLRRELQDAYDKAAGSSANDEGAALIRRMATIRKEARDKQEKALAKVETEHVFDAKTVASVPTEKLAAAKKSFAILSEELSPIEWLTLVRGYADVISKGIDELDPTAPKNPKGN